MDCALVVGTAVVRLGADIVDDVPFEQVVIAMNANGLMRCVMDEIVNGTVADPRDQQCVRIRELQSRIVVNVAVDDRVSTRRQSAAIATSQRDAACARVVHVARLHAVSGSPFDAYAKLPAVTYRATFNAHVCAARHHDRVG